MKAAWGSYLQKVQTFVLVETNLQATFKNAGKYILQFILEGG